MEQESETLPDFVKKEWRNFFYSYYYSMVKYYAYV